jgi:hypothetical protein
MGNYQTRPYDTYLPPSKEVEKQLKTSVKVTQACMVKDGMKHCQTVIQKKKTPFMNRVDTNMFELYLKK